MTEPCAQEKVIKALEKGQVEQGLKLDAVLESQHELGNTIKEALHRLTAIIEADIGTRKDVEQGKKEREILFCSRRKDEQRIDAIEIRNAKCDGAGIFQNFPTMWNWYQGELGWRRFIPAIMTGLSFLILLYVTFNGD